MWVQLWLKNIFIRKYRCIYFWNISFIVKNSDWLWFKRHRTLPHNDNIWIFLYCTLPNVRQFSVIFFFTQMKIYKLLLTSQLQMSHPGTRNRHSNKYHNTYHNTYQFLKLIPHTQKKKTTILYRLFTSMTQTKLFITD